MIAAGIERSFCIGIFCLAVIISFVWQLRSASDVSFFTSSTYPESSLSSLSFLHVPNSTDTPLPMLSTRKKVKGRLGDEKRDIPVESLKVPTPIFILSLPKSGTSSMYMYFRCGRVSALHTWMKNGGRLGVCMENNYLNNTPMVEGCGKSDQVFSDIGYIMGKKCFYPSLQAVNEIVRDYPNSTIIVSYRSVGWHNSIWDYHRLKTRWRKSCSVFPNASNPHVWEDFYVQHSQRIRQAVQGTSVRYLEFDFKDPTAGHQLENFTGISHKCYANCKPNGRCHYPTG